ncbi:MAG: hypothetical protein F6J94_03195 [Moorea sp. SIO1F2]|uniref:hypothetical protein n=1 Tax=Moorena sp. SIO1F2 TaxID=2607819 RepID=UPI0013BBEFD3|nr:hypothetical protein [Moorena sp. SIO1F2]NEO63022.1 hypothetical protein [Moorena sp. SIO4G2]NET81014.1 hypothetical protein [Moorena sp. SIO1F2]
MSPISSQHQPISYIKLRLSKTYCPRPIAQDLLPILGFWHQQARGKLKSNPFFLSPDNCGEV